MFKSLFSSAALAGRMLRRALDAPEQGISPNSALSQYFASWQESCDRLLSRTVQDAIELMFAIDLQLSALGLGDELQGCARDWCSKVREMRRLLEASLSANRSADWQDKIVAAHCLPLLQEVLNVLVRIADPEEFDSDVCDDADMCARKITESIDALKAARFSLEFGSRLRPEPQPRRLSLV